MFPPVICDCIDALIGCHERSIRALETWAVEVGGVGDCSVEAGVSLADLSHEFVEGLAFVKDPADLVDGVPVGRDRPDGAIYSDGLDAPGGGFVKVDEMHEHVSCLPFVHACLIRPPRPVEIGKGSIHDFVKAGQSRVGGGHEAVS